MEKRWGITKKVWIPVALAVVAVVVFVLVATLMVVPGGDRTAVLDLTLQPGTDATAMGFNWYSVHDPQGGVTVVRLAPVSDPNSALIVTGTVGNAVMGKSWHKAEVSGLSPNTEYSYSVSNDGKVFSDVYTFWTGGSGDFQFVAVGDPQVTLGKQNSDSLWPDPVVSSAQGWQDTLDKISQVAPNARFMAGTGDQVNAKPITLVGQLIAEREYGEYFAPAQLRSLPVAPAVGNHELGMGLLPGSATADFNWHFNLPNEDTSNPDLRGDYWYSYNNCLFVVLNTAFYPKNEAQVATLIAEYDKVLAQATAAYPHAKWLFVQHHKSTTLPSFKWSDRDVALYAPQFNALMDKYHVDFVLAGHKHVYTRSWFLKGGQVVGDTGDGTDAGASAAGSADAAGSAAGSADAAAGAGDAGAGGTVGVDSATDPGGTLYFTLNSASGGKYYGLPSKGPGLWFPTGNVSGPLWVDAAPGEMLSEGKSGVANGTGKPWCTAIGLEIKVPQFTVVDVTDSSVTFKTYRCDTLEVIDQYTVNKS